MFKRGPKGGKSKAADLPEQGGRRSRRPEPLVHGGRGRRNKGDDAPRKRRSRAARHPLVLLANMVLFVLVGGVAAGIAGLPLPLDLADRASQLAAFRATGAVIAGATAVWVALVMVLRTPSVLRTPPAERVP